MSPTSYQAAPPRTFTIAERCYSVKFASEDISTMPRMTLQGLKPVGYRGSAPGLKPRPPKEASFPRTAFCCAQSKKPCPPEHPLRDSFKSKIGGIPVYLRRHLIAICTVILVAACSAAQEQPAYRNPKLAIEDRVADLLLRMTLEEKIDQLTWTWGHRDLGFLDTTGQFTPETAAAAFR